MMAAASGTCLPMFYCSLDGLYSNVLLYTRTIKANGESKANVDDVVSIKKKLNVYMTHLVTSDGLLPKLTSHLVVMEKLSMKCFI